MTAKRTYKKELFSLPLDVSETIEALAQQEHREKSHIVTDAIKAYAQKADRRRWKEEARSIVGIIKGGTADIQEIKAHRYD